ncbi:hypothetical protein [Wolbachia endosymbiont of Howardula sp.]|uniref:hypothetical protein n=1 Tax=Wolbachia endosymbiont of Howardula sp. TaxID=2916816 RepID=UPI00217D7D5F|nr:hypothetical protein [Wolbachia endosymbiont of Howardula sp.]UWI83110.1 hypothetical protein MC061_02285 [Wolbachia endosymbiont of Howardula sp.]
MTDLFYIEGIYCVHDQCDTYTGEVGFNDLISGKFVLNAVNGKEVEVNLDIITFNIKIAIDNHNGETINREIEGIEYKSQDDGSWSINKDFGSDKFAIIIRPS